MVPVQWAVDGSGSTYIWGFLDAEFKARAMGRGAAGIAPRLTFSFTSTMCLSFLLPLLVGRDEPRRG